MSYTHNKKANEEITTEQLSQAKYMGFANHMAATGFDEDQVSSLTGRYSELDSQRGERYNSLTSAIMGNLQDPE